MKRNMFILFKEQKENLQPVISTEFSRNWRKLTFNHCLKSRFAKDELLNETYKTELIKVILNRYKSTVVKVYHKIKTYLRALDTFDITLYKYGAVLYYVVKSCFPEDILKKWKKKEEKLTNWVLMEFLKSNVK